jgi:hypothetical protein
LAEQVASRVTSRARSKAYEYYSNLGVGRDDGTGAAEDTLKVLDAGGLAKLLERFPATCDWLARLTLSAGGRVTTFTEAASQWEVETKEVAEWVTKINATTAASCGKEAFTVERDTFGLSQF